MNNEKKEQSAEQIDFSKLLVSRFLRHSFEQLFNHYIFVLSVAK